MAGVSSALPVLIAVHVGFEETVFGLLIFVVNLRNRDELVFSDTHP